MIRKWQALIALLWLALPGIALRYWQVWDRLPVFVANHFDAAGRPNGWMSRETSLIFTLVLVVFMLITATVILSRVRQPDGPSWALLAMFYVVIGALYRVSDAVLDYNLFGTPIQILPVIIPIFVAAFVVIAIFLGAKRGTSLSSAPIVADEAHAGRFWAALLFAPVVMGLAIMFATPNAGIRIAVGLGALILFLASALAWSGFRYLFSHAGVEILALGFRLRSIPVEQIKEYEIGRWAPVGGYGIRGIGDKRAYVWGNRGVRIKTMDGEVFLGHSDPARIVHDLDLIKHFAS